jgi:hypothetical protein
MKLWMKTIVFIILGFMEIVFLSLVFSSTLPRRSADLKSLSKYLSSPTPENHDVWTKEHQKTSDEVNLERLAAFTLALGNLILIGWVVRKPRAPSTARRSGLTS